VLSYDDHGVIAGDVHWQAERYPDLRDLGTRQCWVFSRDQLRGRGWGSNRVQHEIDMRRWSELAPNVVLAHNGRPDYVQRLWCGHLHAGTNSAITHMTACHHAGLRWTARDERVHVITPKGDLVQPLEGYFFHQTRRPYWRWVESAPPGPPRIGLPHAAMLTAERDHSVRRAVGLLAATVQQGLTDVERLQLALTQIRKVRHGRVFGYALGDIAGGAQSFAEIDIGRLCRDMGLQPPMRQTKRRDKEGRWRFLDLEWILPDGRRIVLEIDGSFHMRVEHWSSDVRRERAVVISGATVLRCTSIEIRLTPYDVLSDLRAVGVPTLVPDASAVA
jgi:hypothetical protein